MKLSIKKTSKNPAHHPATWGQLAIGDRAVPAEIRAAAIWRVVTTAIPEHEDDGETETPPVANGHAYVQPGHPRPGRHPDHAVDLRQLAYHAGNRAPRRRGNGIHG